MKNIKISRAHNKSGTPEMLMIIYILGQNWMLMLDHKYMALQECMELPSFLDDVDDNRGRREMTQFVILSKAGTSARF